LPCGPCIRAAVASIAIFGLTAALLGGCGGEGSQDTSASSSAAGVGKQGGGGATGRSASDSASASLPNEGTKRPAPGVPLAKGGDNSIQTYGAEASGAQRAHARAVVEAYLDARAAGSWAQACAYLVPRMRASMQAAARSSQGKVSGCGGVMEAIAANTPQADLQSAAQIEPLSLRVKGPQGFLIFRDGEGTPANMPLNLLGGRWKVTSLIPIPLAL
jgi:hypothetical protein